MGGQGNLEARSKRGRTPQSFAPQAPRHAKPPSTTTAAVFVKMPAMELMKAWVYHPPATPSSQEVAIALEEVPVPPVGGGEVLIEVRKASVCGTDETLFAGQLNRALDGIIPGHEFCGEVAEVGDGVQNVRQGDLVAVESHYSLPGGVDEGIIGLWPPRDSEKRELKAYHGGYSQFSCIPADCAHPLPADLVEGDFWPSLFEPAGNDFLLAREVRKLRPKRVGVFGCGPHGLYAQVFLQHFGIPDIVAFETDSFRADFARGLGCARAVLDPTTSACRQQVEDLTQGGWFDVSLDMVGKDGGVFQSCCRLTRPGGTIVLFDLFTGDFQLNGRGGNEVIFSRQHFTTEIEGKPLDILGVTGREGIWEDLIRSVAGSRELQRLLMEPVTVVGPLDQLGEHVRHRRPQLLKAAFHPFGRA